MKATILVVALAACGPSKGKVVQPVEETAPEKGNEVCRPPLVEIGASVPVPAVLTGMMGPDPYIELVTVGATPAGMRWSIDASIDGQWMLAEASKHIEAKTGVLPTLKDDRIESGQFVLTASWRDGGFEHALTLDGSPENNVIEVTYRCGAATPARLTAVTAAVMSDQLATTWIEPWVLEVLGDRELVSVSTAFHQDGRQYAFELTDRAIHTALAAEAEAQGLETVDDQQWVDEDLFDAVNYNDPSGKYFVRVYEPNGPITIEFEEIADW